MRAAGAAAHRVPHAPAATAEPSHPDCVAAVEATARAARVARPRRRRGRRPRARRADRRRVRHRHERRGRARPRALERPGSVATSPPSSSPANRFLANSGHVVTGAQYVDALDDMPTWSRALSAWWDDHDVLVTADEPGAAGPARRARPDNADPGVGRMGRARGVHVAVRHHRPARDLAPAALERRRPADRRAARRRATAAKTCCSAWPRNSKPRARGPTAARPCTPESTLRA